MMMALSASSATHTRAGFARGLSSSMGIDGSGPALVMPGPLGVAPPHAEGDNDDDDEDGDYDEHHGEGGARPAHWGPHVDVDGVPWTEETRHAAKLAYNSARCSHVLPGLRVSSVVVARDWAKLSAAGVVFVVNAARAVCPCEFQDAPAEPLTTEPGSEAAGTGTPPSTVPAPKQLSKRFGLGAELTGVAAPQRLGAAGSQSTRHGVMAAAVAAKDGSGPLAARGGPRTKTSRRRASDGGIVHIIQETSSAAASGNVGSPLGDASFRGSGSCGPTSLPDWAPLAAPPPAIPVPPRGRLAYLTLNAADANSQDLSPIVPYFALLVEHIRVVGPRPPPVTAAAALADLTSVRAVDLPPAGPSLLTHCHQGVSRSGTLALAHVMWALRLPFDEALPWARTRRGIISPNAGFTCQLLELEDALASMAAAEDGTAAPGAGGGSDDDDQDDLIAAADAAAASATAAVSGPTGGRHRPNTGPWIPVDPGLHPAPRAAWPRYRRAFPGLLPGQGLAFDVRAWGPLDAPLLGGDPTMWPPSLDTAGPADASALPAVSAHGVTGPVWPSPWAVAMLRSAADRSPVTPASAVTVWAAELLEEASSSAPAAAAAASSEGRPANDDASRTALRDAVLILLPRRLRPTSILPSPRDRSAEEAVSRPVLSARSRRSSSRKHSIVAADRTWRVDSAIVLVRAGLTPERRQALRRAVRAELQVWDGLACWVPDRAAALDGRPPADGAVSPLVSVRRVLEARAPRPRGVDLLPDLQMGVVGCDGGVLVVDAVASAALDALNVRMPSRRVLAVPHPSAAPAEGHPSPISASSRRPAAPKAPSPILMPAAGGRGAAGAIPRPAAVPSLALGGVRAAMPGAASEDRAGDSAAGSHSGRETAASAADDDAAAAAAPAERPPTVSIGSPPQTKRPGQSGGFAFGDLPRGDAPKAPRPVEDDDAAAGVDEGRSSPMPVLGGATGPAPRLLEAQAGQGGVVECELLVDFDEEDLRSDMVAALVCPAGDGDGTPTVWVWTGASAAALDASDVAEAALAAVGMMGEADVRAVAAGDEPEAFWDSFDRGF